MPPTAEDADGKPASERLAVRHQVGLHPEVFLRAAAGDPEPDEDLVEDQRDRARRAHFSQLTQPRGVRVPIETRLAFDAVQRGVTRGRPVGVERLERVHQDARDVPARPQHAQRGVVHVFQRVGAANDARRADAGLHIVPPPVVSAAKAHEGRPLGVVPREPHRLHHRFGAGHVERDFIHAGNVLQFPDVVGDHRVVGAEHRTQVADAFDAGVDALLVEVVPEHVRAVGAGEIVRGAAVEIPDEDS